MASRSPRMIDQRVPFHGRGAPTCTDRGASSIRSVSGAGVSGFGAGKGLPSSTRASATEDRSSGHADQAPRLGGVLRRGGACAVAEALDNRSGAD